MHFGGTAVTDLFDRNVSRTGFTTFETHACSQCAHQLVHGLYSLCTVGQCVCHLRSGRDQTDRPTRSAVSAVRTTIIVFGPRTHRNGSRGENFLRRRPGTRAKRRKRCWLRSTFLPQRSVRV